MIDVPVTERADNPPVVGPGHNYATVTDQISDAVLEFPLEARWLVPFGVVFAGMMLLFLSLTYLVLRGIGIWGNNIPVAWGFDIINFVWWIGIGHAGL